MTLKRMKELRELKWTLTEIAASAGVSTKKVFDMLGGRQGPERKEYARHKPRNVDRDNGIREKVKGGASQVEVARLAGLTPQRVHQILKEGVCSDRGFINGGDENK